MTEPIPRLKRMPASVTSQEMRRFDEWASRDFQVTPAVLTENAGRAMADFLVRRFHPARKDPILVMAGKATNGASALAAGRYLLHHGYTVAAVLTDSASKFKDDPKRQLAMFRKGGGSAAAFPEGPTLPASAFIIDGILGYAHGGTAKGPATDMIEAANRMDAVRVALDIPTGIDADTGKPAATTFRAQATLVMALPKKGLLEASAKPFVGELYLADVAFPRALYGDLDEDPASIFGDGYLVRLPDPD